MKDLGYPVAGDDKYGNGLNPLHRLALHAFRLYFYHPSTGQPMKFETPYPTSFVRIFQNSITNTPSITNNPSITYNQ